MINATWLVTGGSGSLGNAWTRYCLDILKPKAIRIFSRGELAQANMQSKFKDDRLRFLIGDVRDLDRLKMAIRGVDYVIHAAALKRIPECEYNPVEATTTNITGTQNVVMAALTENLVKKCVLISTDKSCNPITLYGCTKSTAERIFIQANTLSRWDVLPKHSNDEIVQSRKYPTPIFSIVRYGNVLDSNGSVLPLFRKQAKTGTVTITDKRMTRFWITMSGACKLIHTALDKAGPGEILVPKLKSSSVLDIAKAIAPKAKIVYTGIRPGEKINEELLSSHESVRTRDDGTHYTILPETLGVLPKMEPLRFLVPSGKQDSYTSTYDSLTNPHGLMDENEIRKIIK